MSTRYGTDPDPKSPEEVEREVQQSRAEVEETLEAIQERLSPGQMFEQAVDYMRSSSGNDFLRNLGGTVRDNPVPVALVGTGLVWLMLASSRSTRRQYDDEDDLLEEYRESRYGAGDYPAHPASSEGAEYHDKTELGDTQGGSAHRSGGESVGERVQRAGEDSRGAANELSESARSVRERARRLGTRARHQVSETGEQLWHGARDAGDRASYYGRRVRRGLFDTLQEQPLVLGALGLAVGAAIGAALPATEKEDKWLGDFRDRLKDRAKEAGWEQVEKARAAAGAAYGAAGDETERQGLTPEGGHAAAESAAQSVRQKVERVAEAATEAAKTEAERHHLGHTDNKDA